MDEGGVRPTIRPGVAAVILDDAGRVLLHRRAAGGGWAPVSGAGEPGEDVLTALRREVREETGLGVRVGRLVGVYSDPAFQIVHYPDGRAVHFVTCLFLCHRVGGELTGSDEGLEWRWFAPGRLPDGLLAYADVWLKDALAGPAAAAATVAGVVVR